MVENVIKLSVIVPFFNVDRFTARAGISRSRCAPPQPVE
jgi:hypothetical protein